MIARTKALRAKAAADWHDATPDEMTVPTTIGDEREINPFMRSASAAQLGERRAQKDSF
jgi:hydroxyacylglutathione hydrolase